MDLLLGISRGVHFAAAIALAGVFLWHSLVMRRRAWGADLALIAWSSLALMLVSGAGWLIAVGASMSGASLAGSLRAETWLIVLTRTRFGEIWLWRAGAVLVLAILLLAQRMAAPRGFRPSAGGTAPASPLGRLLTGACLPLAVFLLITLAWSGHGAAEPGPEGSLHLVADCLHLLAAGVWLGMLLPFAGMLARARSGGEPDPLPSIRTATRRYSLLALASVAMLLASGIVNTCYLAGSIPALLGTDYGHLLLVKLGLVAAMLVFGAFNLRRLAPRLADYGRARAAVAWLRRNALGEAALGSGVVAIVAVLGTLPPGLHSEPVWPLPYRLDAAGLSGPALALALVLVASFAALGIGAVFAAATGRFRRLRWLIAGAVTCLLALWLSLRSTIEPAFPTSYYRPAQPYNAASVMRGAALYAAHCAACHGADGAGNGPAAAALPVHPANLIEPHLLAHSPGDLFWWVSNGIAGGAMPAFADAMTSGQRWDVINFITARAAGVLARRVGPEVSGDGLLRVPDFAFETGGRELTLRQALANGPSLLVLFGIPPPRSRLTELAAWSASPEQPGWHVFALELSPQDSVTSAPLLVETAPETKAALSLFRGSADGGETDLLLDRNGAVRARWTADAEGGLPDQATLAAAMREAKRLQLRAPHPADHAH